MNEREGDLRVPLISFLLCICVLIGGIFLILYLFVPNLSQPWFPPIALVLIGFPWLLWLFTYIYTCMKNCFGISSSTENRQISRRASRAPTMPNSARSNGSNANGSTNFHHNHNNNSNSGGKLQGLYGAASINSSKSGGDASITSSQEIEMPLTSAAPS